MQGKKKERWVGGVELKQKKRTVKQKGKKMLKKMKNKIVEIKMVIYIKLPVTDIGTLYRLMCVCIL